MKTDERRFRAIAKVLKVFGIRGEIKIFSYARSAEEYKNLSGCFLGRSETLCKECKIESVRSRGGEIYLKLRGVDDRTAAETLVGQFLFVHEVDRKELPQGSYFIDDLIGCSVQHIEGRQLGIVKSVDSYPSGKMYVVQTTSGEVLMPGVNEIIREILISEKIVRVLPPEGMFDGEMM